jgi:cation diffusion facilitator family transporter
MAFELFKSSLSKIIHPQPIEASPLIIGILIVSILVKVYMFLYNRGIGKKIDSAAMDATAKDSLSDTIATFVVLGTTLAAYFTGITIDGYCGVLVAFFVFATGISAAKETIGPLLGQPPEPEFVKKVESIIMEYKPQGVLGIHDLVVHNYGPGRVMLSVHVEVPSTGDIMVLHDMIDVIEHKLRKELNCSAVIHMDPVCLDDEFTNTLKQKVGEIIKGLDENINFHDFRIVHGPTHTNLIFDIVIPFDYSMTDEQVVAYIQNKIFEINRNYFAVIDVDKAYV